MPRFSDIDPLLKRAPRRRIGRADLIAIGRVLPWAFCLAALGSAPSVADEGATPSGYGLPAPEPAPALPPGMDSFSPPRLGTSDGPAVAEFTRTAGPDETLTLAGPSFTPSTVYAFFGQTTGTDAVKVERRATVSDPVAASVVLPGELPAWSTYLVWPRDGDAYGLPVAVNRTDAWWVGPDQAVPGDSVSLCGRNLSRGNGTSSSWVYLKPRGKAAGRWASVESVNPYRVRFTVPSLAPGTYEVWAHNGHGGDFGWSGPIALDVIADPPFTPRARPRFDVKEHGAKGDGSTDDTASIRRALAAAAKAAPATVYFPAGTYVARGALEPGDKVSWLGDGRDASIIRVGPGFATPEKALVVSESDSVDRVEFRGLRFDGAGNLGANQLFRLRHHDHVRLTGCRFQWQGSVNAFTLDSDHLTITDCDFLGDGLFIGGSRQVRISGNRFRLTDFANAAIASWGGSEVEISGNTARDHDPAASSLAGVGSGRLLVAQSHPDSNRHFYVGENTTINMAPPVGLGDANQGEQILFEVGTSTTASGLTAATPTTATFPVALPTTGPEYPGQPLRSRDAVVIRGRGAGQFRRVTSVEGDTITVSPAWSVVPDGTSVVGVGPAQTRSVAYRNALDGKGDYATYQTASVGLNMYGNVSDVIFAENRVTRTRGGLVAEFSQVPDPRTPTPSALYFNLIVGNSLDGAHTGFTIATNFLTRDAPGTLGHLGNTYRRNTLRNITSHGIGLAADAGGHSGGDLDQVTFEHNAMTGVPTVLWAGRSPFGDKPIRTRWSHVALYRNTFDRGGAAAPEPGGVSITGGTTTFSDVSNAWIGFEGPR